MDILTIIRQTSEAQPDQMAFSSGQEGNNVTYRELMDRADQVAARLIERGCRKGERCGLVLAERFWFDERLMSANGTKRRFAAAQQSGRFRCEVDMRRCRGRLSRALMTQTGLS